jgi:hypothetical protein
MEPRPGRAWALFRALRRGAPQLVRWVIGTLLATAGFGLAGLKATGVR